jgi:hypothetical protein
MFKEDAKGWDCKMFGATCTPFPALSFLSHVLPLLSSSAHVILTCTITMSRTVWLENRLWVGVECTLCM